MRTSFDLPDGTQRNAEPRAAVPEESMPATSLKSTTAPLDQAKPTSTLEVDQETGLHLLRIGRPIIAEEVGRFLAEDH
ncbi:hypothetical protein [Actinomyces glycerinitolerans]|uniref:Uncharacterized protein n=1 Tax=Actinomyces glycerinitolerans TaxID=1892869 RepID=A0A1M4RZH8_9ACTO|nr:hypothetical protein [Actinomyces glycerinitolerans]SHE25395.1 Hypothetical protein ACGLYG10_1611 [Actinomyces glycerinitolerans]